MIAIVGRGCGMIALTRIMEECILSTIIDN